MEEGDDVHVTLRNPQTVPLEWITRREVATDANGAPLDPDDARMAGYEVIAHLITDWRVYDAGAEGDEQPLLGLPATADAIARLPLAIQNRLGEEISSRTNPTRTPATSNS